ncbi:MAG TPA: leucine-rich repeat domain-containing protein [Candidatus Alistipes cottocaccae]|nr:leucine-rich repeat domain-containing protein [Candidatus Alistipes cottocaccae]
MKRFYLLALAATLAFTGCKKDDGDPRPENLTIEKTEYALDAVEERTATVAFTAAADWTLSVVYDDAESSADWLSVTPMSGTAGEQTVELSAARNFRASDRTAYADLVCGEQSVRLTVTQTAASEVVDFTAQFDPGFAQKLQELGIIADAEHITPADMEKIAAMTELDISGTYENPGAMTSLQGIEYFEALSKLICYYNSLTSLDVRANTALTELYCANNELTTLDVSANTALTLLICGGNQLTSLDVSANTALTYLYCGDNQLTTLDESANTALTYLSCGSNQLTSLDVRANTALTWLDCASNSLTTLDVSANTALTDLHCGSNQLTSLDVSANTALTWLSCKDNPGDGESTFPVTAWFDNETVPAGLNVYSSSWTYGGKTITIDFRKAE